jgi:hypothetical protein
MLKNKILTLVMLAMAAASIFSCARDPYEDVTSNERSIENVTISGEGLTQVGPAVVDKTTGKAIVKVLIAEGKDLSSVATTVQAAYRAKVTPNAGEPINFKSSNNKATFQVTSERGVTKDWEVEIVPFSETILGTYKIENLVVFGGTGTEYGGGGVLPLTDKPWDWPELGGPAAELDNVITFEFTGATSEGQTYGKFINNAGADAMYADFQFVADPKTDVNHHYRKLPKGEGTWTRDYSKNTVTFKFADGTTTTGVFEGPKTETLGNGLSKTIINNSLAFTLNGTDDWDKIYSDYDKFVKKPRKFWIDIKKQ